MRKLALCLPLIVAGMLMNVPTHEAKPKKVKTPTPEEFTEAFFDYALANPEKHDSVTPGDLSARKLGMENAPAEAFAKRRLEGNYMLPWPIFCAADTDNDMKLTRKELTSFMKSEEKGKAPTPKADDFAYGARVEGISSFMENLKDDANKDGKLSKSELALADEDGVGFDTADLNGDGALDIHEYPGWFALGFTKPENDPFRFYRYEGSTWTYDLVVREGSPRLSESWEVETVTDNSALVRITRLIDGEEKEDDPPAYLRLWFSAGRQAWCMPGNRWSKRPQRETLELPVGAVEAHVYESVIYGDTRTEYYADEYPGVPVKFELSWRRDSFDAVLSSVDLKEPKSRKKKGKEEDNGAAENAAKLAGVNIFLMLDKNKDGRITAREYLDGTKKYRDEQCKGKDQDVRPHMEAWISPRHFVFADSDDTEGLSRDEFDAYRKRFERFGSFPSPPTISRADLDRMCAIVAEDELDRYDTDRDGALTESDPVAGESWSGYRRFHKADLDTDLKVTRGELEEYHRSRVLARAPDLAAAKESDSGKHDWKLEDKNLNFALFQKAGRKWTIRMTLAAGGKSASGHFENEVLRCDDEGAVLLTRGYGPDGDLLVSAKQAISFTPEFGELLQPTPNAKLNAEKSIKAAGRKWTCDVYTVKLEGGIDGEEWISREMPGLRIKNSAIKNGRKVLFELTEFKD